MVKKRREDYALEVLKRWGRLNAKQVQALASAAMGRDIDGYPIKTLYSHLKNMVIEGLIDVEEYGPGGELLIEEEHKVKNPRKLFIHPESIKGVSGQDLIEEIGGQIYCPKSLRHFYSVFEGLASVPSETEIHLYMNINQAFINLRIDIDVFNSSLLIGRSREETNNNEMDSVSENFNKRTLLLELPHPKISSYKNTKDSGHCLLSFTNEKTVSITDQGSSNGTSIKVISDDTAEELRRKGELIGEATMTSDWINVPIDEIINLKEMEQREVQLPFILELGGEFKILFAHSDQV
ncbi:MAG: FHA domain-containing protein [Bacteriovoracaceae bacterium]|nr:FHA domain-containing protein [Bacteriovoracaceae bacterium]